MRRLVDVLVALCVAVLAAPAYLVTAVLVRLSLGRPVLFRQTRVGRDGREFSIAKFRTMRAERWPGEPDADRDCRVGRMLRTLSLDELPQVWNVLAGDMSLIGPRPTLPEQVRHYSAHQRRRLEVRPGLTGWAQVNGRNSISWPERIELDIWYIDHRNLALDLRILRRTVLQLVRPSGVYGDGGINPGFPAPEERA
ncbi:sugar transferase [Nocardioides mesophilus]|uniref:Sugar transferase n=1 Tax=Nocardioides mesophilus TaxID=433659 RepID=A0A7G9R9A0_9ACTN|nr:sugar transferase [Nocardioides mesophilus]QNN52175.1 sugar transferase [Nocardioides mesophilus]